MLLAFITGVNGQDGSFLSELLLEKGYFVYGIIRRTSMVNTRRIDHLAGNDHFATMYGDVSDMSNLLHLLQTIQKKHPGYQRLEIYHLAAQSHVKVSFEEPIYTTDVNALGTLHLLECIRLLDCPRIRFYQASTSELYGKVQEVPQTEKTPFYPRSPYAIAKLCGYWLVKNYRESYGIYASNGILFNHESTRRGETFITRKITMGIGKILRGEEECLQVGNLHAKRDWGHAKDYVRGMWLILQHPSPDDFVLATGECHSVREFIEKAFALRNMDIVWDEQDRGIDRRTGRVLVRISERYFRPAEVDLLMGDASKACQLLGWQPTISFDDLVREMVDHDCPKREEEENN